VAQVSEVEPKRKRVRNAETERVVKNSIRVQASQRYKNVRKEMKIWLDALVRIYEATDPAFGEVSEDRKLEQARQAIELWWYLYRYLMLWAQSQIVGYEWATQNPDALEKLAKRLKLKTVNQDSHLLEYIGLTHVFNLVNDSDPNLERVTNVLKGMGDAWTLEDETLRLIIRELLVSRSTESSFWRFPLQQALYSLNLGEAQSILRPAAVKKQGSPTNMQFWKARALCHVHFKMGQGIKKYTALEAVADSLGQSVETLRSWEKSLSLDEDLADNFYTAHVAGRHAEILEPRPGMKGSGARRDDPSNRFVGQNFRNVPLYDRARWQAQELKRYPLDAIRKGLLDSPTPAKMVRKKRVAAPKKR
jgi:hypothetical protein